MLKRAQLFDLHDMCEYYDVGPISLLSGRLTEIACVIMLRRAQLFNLHDMCEYYDVGPISLLSGRLTEIACVLRRTQLFDLNEQNCVRVLRCWTHLSSLW